MPRTPLENVALYHQTCSIASMKTKTLFFLSIGIIVGALVVFRLVKNSENEPKNATPTAPKPLKVTALIVTPQNFSNTISLSGSLEANEEVTLHPEVSGIAEKILFTEGTRVQKGQLLVKINDAELRAQLTQALTKERLTSEQERRARLLLEKEAISREEYDIASADYRTAKAQKQLIQVQIAKTSLRAPFTGTIGLRSISPGTYVTPTTAIAHLVNTQPLKVAFSLPEKYATAIRLHQTIQFTVANTKDVFTAKIYALEPMINATTRTLQVRAYADNKKGALLPGTFANIQLPLKNIPDAIRIPSEVVIPVKEGKKVFVARQGKAQSVPIETLTRTGKEVIVTSGLRAGDTLLISGIMALKDDLPVELQWKP